MTALDTRATVAPKPAPVTRRRRKIRWGTVGRFVGLALIVLAFLGPIVWMVLASFKHNVQIHDASKAFIFDPTLTNYGTVFDPRRGNYLVYIWNSFFVAFMATALSLVLAVPAAYAMSRFIMNKSAMVVLLARRRRTGVRSSEAAARRAPAKRSSTPPRWMKALILPAVSASRWAGARLVSPRAARSRR